MIPCQRPFRAALAPTAGASTCAAPASPQAMSVGGNANFHFGSWSAISDHAGGSKRSQAPSLATGERRARAFCVWSYAPLILRGPRASEGLEGCSRDRVNAPSGASFEAASRRLRTRSAGGRQFQANAARSRSGLPGSTASSTEMRSQSRRERSARRKRPLVGEKRILSPEAFRRSTLAVKSNVASATLR